MKHLLMVLLVTLAAGLYGYDFYTVNSESQTLSYVNTETGSIDPDYAILGAAAYAAPNRMAILDNTGYVTITYENTIQLVTLPENRTRTTIYLGDNVLPYDVCVGADYIWVTGSGSELVYQIDPASNEIVNTVATGTYPQSILYYDGKLYVSNTGFNPADWSYAPGTVTVIDAATCSVLTTIDTDLNPQDMMIHDGQIHLVCTGDYNSVSGKIDIIAPDTNQIVDILNLGGSPGSIAVSEDGRMFVGNAWPAGVYVYDAATLDILVTPGDYLFHGGNALAIYDSELLSVDAGDYIQNSDVYRYDLSDNSLLNTYEVAVGVTDVIVKKEVESIEDDPIEPQEKIVLRAWPNPALRGDMIQFSLPEGFPVDRYHIYDVRGRRIADIHGNSWDGRDIDGKRAGSGIYFCVAMKGSKQLSIKKITIIR